MRNVFRLIIFAAIVVAITFTIAPPVGTSADEVSTINQGTAPAAGPPVRSGDQPRSATP